MNILMVLNGHAPDRNTGRVRLGREEFAAPYYVSLRRGLS
jgi:hypothetical protein